MKKIISLVLLAFVFAFAINLVYADDLNSQDNSNMYTTVLSDLDNYSQSEFSIKIRLTQLLGSIDTKIYQLNSTIDYLLENQIETTELETKLSEFESIKIEVQDLLDSNSSSIDDLILNYVSIKNDSLKLVQESRDLIKSTVPTELYPELKDQFQSQKKELNYERQQMIKSLVLEHNMKIKQNMNKGFNSFRQSFCDGNSECFKDKDLLKEGYKNKLLENKTQNNINHQMMVNKNFDRLQTMTNNRKNNFNNMPGKSKGGNK